MSREDELIQSGLILTDDTVIDPILDFNLYSNAIVNIIKNSHPKFSIGVFGDWGTGKTTLINSVDKALQTGRDLVKIRLEASRYKREMFPLVSLLKSIAYTLPDEKEFENLKLKLETSAINFLKRTPDILTSIISKYASEEDEVSHEMISTFKKELNSKIQLIAELDRDSIYFDGFREIKKEIKNLREDNPAFRIVIFADDLDKCPPGKAFEILEMIRVFHDIEGFIYVIGLSHDMIVKLSNVGNSESSIDGERYIKMLIQVPITLPKWSNQDIVRLVKDLIKKGMIHDKFKDVVDKNIELISVAIDNNPREIKRFLNNFFVACEIFSGKKNFEAKELIFSGKKNFEAKELLVVQAVHLRWNKFYNILVKSDESFFRGLDKYLKMDDETRLKSLDLYEEKKDEFDTKVWKVLRDFKTDSDLWDFLVKNSNTLRNVRDWSIYSRAIEVAIEPTGIPGKTVNYEAVKLLQSGKINEFNDKRAIEFKILSIREADLRDADLRDADLIGANLSGADLDGADLMGANLSGADLMGANLSGARLVGTNLGGADLVGARLWGANLISTRLWGANLRDAHLVGARLMGANLGGARLVGANLGGARLVGVDLGGADLKHTELTNSIIINPHYESLTVNSSTEFNNAIIDDSQFIDYITQYTRNVPQKIKDKKKLRRELAKKGVSEENIEDLLSISKLPEE
ncbi:MAG: pentapeptide repeat-containing protein [Nitrososphaeraceae archaeon]|nr:pentapeptide repeat-containing protein [Nitrososphaeraceae archaeon]MDW0180751.1 pentapeptide repeat-containing protein [Nitrososphaeraceae archaeon]MDW0190754.1 pentapeptide repeat-containing protein [Nitrososphaeraceae archaeon]MDW0246646.1 pentapeptide repeat-containing protein [Nitrososphaeraceae archaeon]MDW0251145.1 pentapeptide repeat-containing protein [Nitrososphaeraceae archaeon]